MSFVWEVSVGNMTEGEWLKTTNAKAMWMALYGEIFTGEVGIQEPSKRKQRLFAVACCREEWENLPDKRSRDCVEAAELYADGKVSKDKLVKAFESQANVSACYIAHFAGRADMDWGIRDITRNANDVKLNQGIQANLTRDIIGNPFRPVMVVGKDWGEFIHHDKHILFYEKWRTPQVMDLALAAYEQRLDNGQLDPFWLALVADALEESGCIGHKENPCFPCGGHGYDMQAGPDRGPAPKCSYCNGKGWRDWPHPIIEHLRSEGSHYRGMWSLDVLLGKE